MLSKIKKSLSDRSTRETKQNNSCCASCVSSRTSPRIELSAPKSCGRLKGAATQHRHSCTAAGQEDEQVQGRVNVFRRSRPNTCTVVAVAVVVLCGRTNFELRKRDDDKRGVEVSGRKDTIAGGEQNTRRRNNNCDDILARTRRQERPTTNEEGKRPILILIFTFPLLEPRTCFFPHRVCFASALCTQYCNVPPRNDYSTATTHLYLVSLSLPLSGRTVSQSNTNTTITDTRQLATTTTTGTNGLPSPPACRPASTRSLPTCIA